MNQEIDKILIKHGLKLSGEAKKIDVGFTNTVYQLSDKYILKICSEGNEIPFKNESRLYEYFQDKLPVPKLIAYDQSNTITHPYMIYKKIDGDNLYNVWHQLSDAQRQQIVKQICELLKVINRPDINDLPPDVALKPITTWREVILNQLEKYLEIAQKMRTITGEDTLAIKQYSEKHAASLDQQIIALVYWDVHFDNFLVKGDQVVGLLDLEGTKLASIDYVLDVIKRMVDFPIKYMSKQAEQFAKAEDYAKLMDWYKDFYPELFDFQNIDRRLDLYSILHDLKDLEGWPNVQQLKDNIRAITKNP